MKTTLHEGKHIRLVAEDGWEFVERKAAGVVAIAAVTPDGQLLLTEQFRIPVGARVIELPAGLVGDGGDEGEPARTAAARELEEETGWAAESLEELGRGPASAGLSSEVIVFFLASELTRKGEGGGVEGEQIELHQVHLDSIDPWLQERAARGVLIDPKIQAALWMMQRKE